MARIQQTRQSQEDLISIWDFIARVQRRPRSADSVLRELDSAIQRLAENPFLGQAADSFRVGLRMFPKLSYIIFYEPTESGIRIIRILHGARSLEELL